MNYQTELDKIINNLNNKPKLLLHACCAPCSTHVLEYLNTYFDITIYFYNPNIDTIEEYNKRLNELKRLINTVFPNVKLLEGKYSQEEFFNKIKGLENELEGGLRCSKCYQLRLEETAKKAKELNFDYFATTLTVSPYKNAKVINEIGYILEKQYGIFYLLSDFKKKEGYKKSIKLSKKYNLYRQNYCGCLFSKKC